MLRATGKDAEAFEIFRRSYDIRERLVQHHPDNPEWTRGLAASCERIGDMLRNTGKRADAMQMYRKSLALREKLEAIDPNNIRWREELAVPLERIGKELLFLNQRGPAIESFRKALTIREGLADGPNVNTAYTLYQLGLAGDAAHERFSRALMMLQQLDEGGRLSVNQHAMISDIRQQLAKLQR
jgi:tetratricopeptide (TPR) repeat protein